jgi:hypothetical protein
VRFHEADDDPAVRLEILAIHEDWLTIDAGPHERQAGRLESAVVHDPQASGDRITHDRLDLVRRRRPMRAGADEDGHLTFGNVGQLAQDPGQEAVARQRPRHVGNHDRDALVGAHERRERPRIERCANSLEKRRLLVRKARDEAWREHGHLVAGHRHIKTVRPVLQSHFHRFSPALWTSV